MKYILTIFSFCLFSVIHAQDNDEKTIRSILADQTAQWNKGNIEGFMKGYWNNDSLLFVGSKGPTYGYQKTLSNYKKSYPSTDAMGKLAFDILKVQKISPDCYFILGKWALTRVVGDVSGHYTLIFKKINGEWLIVADHSS